MKTPGWTKSVWIAVLLLAGLSAAGAGAARPGAEFACQVTVEGGRIGLVTVLASSRELAEKATIGAEAFATDNTRGPAEEVVQCIRQGKERFEDYQFQQFYERVPR